MTFTKSKPGFKSDSSTLVRYESLRLQVLNKSDSSERSLGLSLFIRQGMLAWIEVCHQCTPANSTAKKPTRTPVFVYKATSEMIKIMANITLCNLEEALS
jgi:hypothetical protein